MARPAHLYVDIALRYLKWPAAVVSLLLVLPAAATLLDACHALWRNGWRDFLPMLLGIGALFSQNWIMQRRLIHAGFFEIDQHEQTHRLFATLTLHRVVLLQVTDGSGGRIEFRGDGNWLITIAPYFFPTLPLLAGCASMLLPEGLRSFGIVAVGYTLASFLVACTESCHSSQVDLNEVGLPFAAMFCPGALTAAVALVLSLAAHQTGPIWFLARFQAHIVALLA